MKISVQHNLGKVMQQMKLQADRMTDAAKVDAINRTALGVRLDLYAEMRKVFDSPTAYTLKSLYVKRATVSNPVAVVWLKNNYDERKAHYLAPNIFGGGRPLKRFEYLLRRIGVLPDGMYAVPGQSAKFDANGNMSRGQIVEVLAYLQAFYLSGSTANTTAARRAKLLKGSKKKKGYEYIVVKEKRGGIVPGIWRVEHGGLGRSIRPILIFVRMPQYKVRFRFFAVAKASISERIVRNFREAWSKQQASKGGA